MIVVFMSWGLEYADMTMDELIEEMEEMEDYDYDYDFDDYYYDDDYDYDKGFGYTAPKPGQSFSDYVKEQDPDLYNSLFG